MPDESSYRRYPEYKDSGVEWLGEIPEGWEVSKVKRIGTVVNGSTPSSKDETYWDGQIQWFTPEDLSAGYKEIFESKRKITDEGINNAGLSLLPANSLLISSRAPIGNLALIAEEFTFNQGCKGISFLSSAEPGFYYYLFSSITNLLESLGQGSTFTELSAEKLKTFQSPLPPKPTQHRIADFLDTQTAKIDRLLGINDRKIELLKEYRKAVISHAVTKGLDPGARMKDSGVEWLGKIPEEWGVKRLKHFASVLVSNVDKHSKDTEQDVRLCNYVDVYYKDLLDNEINFMKATASVNEINKFQLFQGDILVTKDSESWDDIAIPAYVIEKLDNVVCGYHVAIIRTMDYVNEKYIFWAFLSRSLNIQFQLNANGITRFGLSRDSINNAIFVIPPIDTQKVISNFLDAQTAKIDTEIQKIEKQNELLTEYRQSLISNAVTGKIMV